MNPFRQLVICNRVTTGLKVLDPASLKSKFQQDKIYIADIIVYILYSDLDNESFPASNFNQGTPKNH